MFNKTQPLKKFIILSALVLMISNQVVAGTDSVCLKNEVTPGQGLKRLVNKFELLRLLPNFCRNENRVLMRENKIVHQDNLILINTTLKPLDSIFEYASQKTFDTLKEIDQDLVIEGKLEVKPDLTDEDFYQAYLYKVRKILTARGKSETEINKEMLGFKNNICRELSLYYLGERELRSPTFVKKQKESKSKISAPTAQMVPPVYAKIESVPAVATFEGIKIEEAKEMAKYDLYTPAVKVFRGIKELLTTTKIDKKNLQLVPYVKRELMVISSPKVGPSKGSQLLLTDKPAPTPAPAIKQELTLQIAGPSDVKMIEYKEKKNEAKPEAVVATENRLIVYQGGGALVPSNKKIMKVYMTEHPYTLRTGAIDTKHRLAQIRMFGRKMEIDDTIEDHKIEELNKRYEEELKKHENDFITPVNDPEAGYYTKLALSKEDLELLERKDLFYSSELRNRFDEMIRDYQSIKYSNKEKYNKFRYYNNFMFRLLKKAYSVNYNQEFMEEVGTESEHYANFKRNREIFKIYRDGNRIIPTDEILKKYADRVYNKLDNVYLAKSVYEYRANQVSHLNQARFMIDTALNSFDNNAHFSKKERQMYSQVFTLHKDKEIFFNDQGLDLYRAFFLGQTEGIEGMYIIDLSKDNGFHKYGQVMTRLAMESYRLSQKYDDLRYHELTGEQKDKLAEYIELFDKAQEVYTTGSYGVKTSPSNAGMMAAASNNLRKILYNTATKVPEAPVTASDLNNID